MLSCPYYNGFHGKMQVRFCRLFRRLGILKSITENGEELLSTLDSDEELNRVYDLFMEQLMDDEDGDN